MGCSRAEYQCQFCSSGLPLCASLKRVPASQCRCIMPADATKSVYWCFACSASIPCSKLATEMWRVPPEAWLHVCPCNASIFCCQVLLFTDEISSSRSPEAGFCRPSPAVHVRDCCSCFVLNRMGPSAHDHPWPCWVPVASLYTLAGILCIQLSAFHDQMGVKDAVSPLHK
jgi:hypothetical protein